MMKFGSFELKLGKDVAKGDKESLQTLFHSAERYQRTEILTNAEEDATIRVMLEGLGEADLQLGDDMEKGQQKTIMTLFWFVERAKPIVMKKGAKRGDSVVINMFLVS
jgi:hypothetical protein